VRISSLLQAKGGSVATIAPQRTVRDVVAELARHGIGALVVTEDGERIIGIVSERDVVRALHQRGATVLDDDVASVMTAEVRTCAPDDSVHSLMATMTEHRVRHVPVVVEGVLSGIVSIGDVVKQRIGELESENSAIIEYIQTGR
jgi:CBS domain-containing protein